MPIAAIVAGGLGAVARYITSGSVQRRSDPALPLGTATVNLVGAFAVGVAAGVFESGSLGFELSVGFLGGFTTFSTWIVETLRLAQRGGGRMVAALNLTVPALAGVALGAIGYHLAG